MHSYCLKFKEGGNLIGGNHVDVISLAFVVV